MPIFLMPVQDVPLPPRPTAPPPPIVMVTPPAPPAPPMARREIERFLVDVEIRAGGELLWSGPLRVASGQPSTFRRDSSEPAAQSCADVYGSGAQQNSLQFSITPSWQPGPDPQRAMVLLRWGRPGANPCVGRSGGARSVELSDSVLLAAGQWATVTGDAGLVLRIRRR